MLLKYKKFSRPISICIAFAMFALVIAELIFVASPVQNSLYMYGLLITELMLFVTAVAGCFITRQDPREMFPVKKPLVRQIFGVLVFWIGCYMLIITLTIAVSSLAPQALMERSADISSFLTTVNPFVSFLIVAVSPAICEEAVHRGFILHFLRPIENKWLIIVIMGVLFGVFHLDPIRFVPTALLGGAITYIALETDNLLLGALLHFINNALPAAISFVSYDSDALSNALTEEAMAEASKLIYGPLGIGSTMIFAFSAPWIVLAGSVLIHGKGYKCPHLTAKIIICALSSAVLLIGGILLTALGIWQSFGSFLAIPG